MPSTGQGLTSPSPSTCWLASSTTPARSTFKRPRGFFATCQAPSTTASVSSDRKVHWSSASPTLTGLVTKRGVLHPATCSIWRAHPSRGLHASSPSSRSAPWKLSTSPLPPQLRRPYLSAACCGSLASASSPFVSASTTAPPSTSLRTLSQPLAPSTSTSATTSCVIPSGRPSLDQHRQQRGRQFHQGSVSCPVCGASSSPPACARSRSRLLPKLRSEGEC